MSKLLNNNAYKAGSFDKINPRHHQKAAGGYRDYKTNPIPVDTKKAIEVNRTPQNNGKINIPNGPAISATKPGLPSTVKEMEKGTTDNTRNILIIVAILAVGGGIYYYYR